MSPTLTTTDLRGAEAEAAEPTALGRAQYALRSAVSTGKGVERAALRVERARTDEARRAARERDRAAAQLQVAAENRDREREAKRLKADRIERELRKREPYCEVHAAGKVIRIRLAHEDALGRGTSVEAARRVIYMATHRFQDAVTASRGALAPVPERQWLAEMKGSSAGLLPAQRMDLVKIEDELTDRASG